MVTLLLPQGPASLPTVIVGGGPQVDAILKPIKRRFGVSITRKLCAKSWWPDIIHLKNSQNLYTQGVLLI